MDHRPIILFMDEDTSFVGSARAVLEGQGFRVEVCPDAPRGLELAPRLKPDLVITDMVLPGRSGFHVVEQLKNLDRSLPIIMVATFGTPAQQQLAEFLGAD